MEGFGILRAHGKVIIGDQEYQGDVTNDVENSDVICTLFSDNIDRFTDNKPIDALIHLHGGAYASLTSCRLVSISEIEISDATHRDRYFVTLSSKYLTVGSRDVRPWQNTITRARVQTKYMDKLFFADDYSIVGGKIVDPTDVEKMAHFGIDLEVGTIPVIIVSTGARDVFSVESAGISVHCRREVYIRKEPPYTTIQPTTFFDLQFRKPTDIQSMFYKVGEISSFLTLLCNRYDYAISCKLLTDHPTAKDEDWIDSYIPTHYHPIQQPELPIASWSDMPTNPLVDRAEFERVLTGWLNSSAERAEAWRRLVGQLTKQGRYDPDRLIAAANVFDLLPEDVKPSGAPLTPELESAKKRAMELFGDITDKSEERAAALSAIGRIGSAVLREIVLHRLRIIPQSVRDERFPGIDRVVTESIKLRNALVHGGRGKVIP